MGPVLRRWRAWVRRRHWLGPLEIFQAEGSAFKRRHRARHARDTGQYAQAYAHAPAPGYARTAGHGDYGEAGLGGGSATGPERRARCCTALHCQWSSRRKDQGSPGRRAIPDRARQPRPRRPIRRWLSRTTPCHGSPDARHWREWAPPPTPPTLPRLSRLGKDNKPGPISATRTRVAAAS